MDKFQCLMLNSRLTGSGSTVVKSVDTCLPEFSVWVTETIPGHSCTPMGGCCSSETIVVELSSRVYLLVLCMVGMFQTTADMIQFVGTRFPCSTVDEQKNRCRSCAHQITLGAH